MEGEKVTRLKDYSVDIDYMGVYAVDTDEFGHLWIGTGFGEVIIANYC